VDTPETGPPTIAVAAMRLTTAMSKLEMTVALQMVATPAETMAEDID
jgi:hypothetical protein